MKKHPSLKVAFLAYVILAVAGCASPSDHAASSAKPVGPAPVDFRQLVEIYMAPQLRNPDSAHYKSWSAPVRSGTGWSVEVSIDDRNAEGTYSAGLKRYQFVLSGGRVVSQLELPGADCVGSACPSDDKAVKPRFAEGPAHQGSNGDHAAGDKPDPPSHSTF